MKYNKYRFAKQIKKNDCFPNAIINLFKFFNVKISYKDNYNTLYQYLKIDTYGGTHPKIAFDYLLNKKNKLCKLVGYKKNLNITYLKNLLQKNNLTQTKKRAIVLLFHSKINANGHACLIVGANKKGFDIVNFDEKTSIKNVSFDNFRKKVLNYKKAYFFIYERK